MQDINQKSTTQIYNDWAIQYKKSCEDFVFPGNMFEYFLDELSGKKILDVWCAFWRDVMRLRAVWYEAYGIDISQELLTLADSSVSHFLFEWDITNLDKLYSNSSFDWIISSVSIVHLDKNIALKALEDIFNLLQNSWVFFLTLKISESWDTIFKNSTSLPGVQKKYVYYKESEILKILEEIWLNIYKTHIYHNETDDWMSIICKK